MQPVLIPRFGHVTDTSAPQYLGLDPNYANTYGSYQAEGPTVRGRGWQLQLHVQPERHHTTAKGQEKSCHPHLKGWEGTRALLGVQDKAANTAKIHIPSSAPAVHPPPHMQYMATASPQAAHLFWFVSHYAMSCLLFPTLLGWVQNPDELQEGKKKN